MRTKLMLYGLESTVDNPLDIILGTDLKKVLGLDPSIYTVNNTKPDDALKSFGMGGTSSSNTLPAEWIRVDGSEIPEEDSGTMEHPERYTEYNLFQDNEIGVRAGTLRYKRRKNIKFTYYSQSKSKVISMVEKLRSFDIYNAGKKKHKLEYSYDLPPEYLWTIDHVRTLKNKRLPKEEQLDLIDYINKYSIQKVSRVNTTDATPYKFNLTIREHLYDVTGILTTETYNLEVEEGENNYWSFTIEYSVWYQKPIMLVLQYPVLIWNTPLDSRLTKVVARPEVRSPVQGTPDYMYRGLYWIGKPNSDYKGYYNVDRLVLPLIDDFDNFPDDYKYRSVCSMLIVVDDKNPYEVANIKHLPNYTIRESFLNYLLEEPSEATELMKGLFNIQLYRNGVLDSRNKITMDREGNITTEFPMDIKSTYRIIIRVMVDLDYMKESSLRRLNRYVYKQLEEYKSRLQEDDKHKLIINPHRKDKLYYVDEFGNILDNEGYVVYTDGTRVTVNADDITDEPSIEDLVEQKTE